MCGQPPNLAAKTFLTTLFTSSASKGFSPPGNLYQMVMNEVEAPLIEAALHHTGGNQSHAAEILGMSRGTLRKKLKLHGLGK